MRLIIITANVITIGELFAAIQISDILVMPIINVSSDISSFLSAKKLKEKLTEAFESNTNKASPLNTSAQKIKNLVLKNIMVYKNDKTVLNIEELVITRGKKYLILGPNGSGKSTLLNVIAGVEENFNGAIEVNGKPEAKSTRSFDFAYASQHPFLFNDTLINNITLYQKYDRDILEKTLALLGIRELSKRDI